MTRNRGPNDRCTCGSYVPFDQLYKCYPRSFLCSCPDLSPPYNFVSTLLASSSSAACFASGSHTTLTYTSIYTPNDTTDHAVTDATDSHPQAQSFSFLSSLMLEAPRPCRQTVPISSDNHRTSPSLTRRPKGQQPFPSLLPSHLLNRPNIPHHSRLFQWPLTKCRLLAAAENARLEVHVPQPGKEQGVAVDI